MRAQQGFCRHGTVCKIWFGKRLTISGDTWWTGCAFTCLLPVLWAFKKVGVVVCFLLASEFLGKEGIGMAVQTGVTWKQEIPGKLKSRAESKQSGRQSSEGKQTERSEGPGDKKHEAFPRDAEEMAGTRASLTEPTRETRRTGRLVSLFSLTHSHL